MTQPTALMSGSAEIAVMVATLARLFERNRANSLRRPNRVVVSSLRRVTEGASSRERPGMDGRCTGCPAEGVCSDKCAFAFMLKLLEIYYCYVEIGRHRRWRFGGFIDRGRTQT